MKKSLFYFLFVLSSLVFISCNKADTQTTTKLTGQMAMAQRFIDKHVSEYYPILVELNKVRWEANTTGRSEAYEHSQEKRKELTEYLSDPDKYQQISDIWTAVNANPTEANHIVQRQIKKLYYQYKTNHVDKDLLNEITEISSRIKKTFNTFRAEVDGKKLSSGEVYKILKTSTNSEELQKTWEASKEIAQLIEADLIKLAKLRNKQAQQSGFKNYQEMSLTLEELDPQTVEELFANLDKLIRKSFQNAKKDIDAFLAHRYQIAEKDLMPWHYQNPFFQEAPKTHNVDLDAPYQNEDIPKLTGEFFDSIGLNVDDSLARSDHYPREGKNQHAFCTDIDSKGDVRVLANIVPGKKWMGIMLHEYGHVSYMAPYIPLEVPILLRYPTHLLNTEGVAMLFEEFPTHLHWLKDMGLQIDNEDKYVKAAMEERRNTLLIFSRWTQVMYYFEKGLYENPDQDLNKLWWDLVEEYQELKKPEGRNAPDYASKYHVAMAPVYYHNYQFGQLFASQVKHHIADNILGIDLDQDSFVGKKAVGEYFKEKIYSQGSILDWNKLTEFATGKKLSAEGFARDIGASKNNYK